MTTSDAQRETLRQISADIQRVSRPQTIAEDQGAALERAAELFLSGLRAESRFVAEQGRQG